MEDGWVFFWEVDGLSARLLELAAESPLKVQGFAEDVLVNLRLQSA